MHFRVKQQRPNVKDHSVYPLYLNMLMVPSNGAAAASYVFRLCFHQIAHSFHLIWHAPFASVIIKIPLKSSYGP